MAQEKKQSFMKGAVILSASTLIVKVLGLLFSVPLANFISPEGMSHFYIAYDIFTMFLTLSTAGLPVAVSRMVGTAYAQGRRKEADRAFGVAFWLFFSIGLFGCLVMIIFAKPIAKAYGSAGASYAIMALAPTMFFISIMSAVRGYFQGRSNMVPTATSQIIEAVSKVIIGVGLALFIIQKYDSDSWAAVGAITGVSISAGLGTIYLISYKLRTQKREKNLPEGETSGVSSRDMLISLVRFAVPITLGACFLTFLDTIDSAVMMDRLKTAAEFTQLEADWFRGVLGNARKFFDLPGAFVVPVSTSLLPVLSGAIAAKDEKTVDHISSTSLRVTMLISIPASVGMCIFAEPICQLLLFGNAETAEGTAPLLGVMSVAIVFSSTLLTTNAILQSFGRPVVPVIDMAVGGVVKIAVTYFLTGIPEVNAMGSAISTVVSYLVIMTLNFINLKKSLPTTGKILKNALPMLLSAAIMGAASYALYWLLGLIVSPRIAVLPAIVVAVAVYAFCIVKLRAVTYDDVLSLPKGEKIARLLKMKATKKAEE